MSSFSPRAGRRSFARRSMNDINGPLHALQTLSGAVSRRQTYVQSMEVNESLVWTKVHWLSREALRVRGNTGESESAN